MYTAKRDLQSQAKAAKPPSLWQRLTTRTAGRVQGTGGLFPTYVFPTHERRVERRGKVDSPPPGGAAPPVERMGALELAVIAEA